MHLWTVTRLTLREAGRRRLLVTLAILTLAMVAFTGWGFSRLPTLNCGGQGCPPAEIKLAGAFLLIMVTYIFNSILAIGSVFVAAPSIAGEIESGLALAILPRPIRRSEIVLGKWLGLVLLIAFYTLLSGGLEFAVVQLVLNYLPPQPIIALLYLVGETIVLLTFATLLSTRFAPMTGGVISVVVFGMAWLAGVSEAIGFAFSNATMINVGVAMSLLLPTDGLWRGAIYSLEPVAMIVAGSSQRAIAAANPFFVTAPPTTPYLVWAVLWVMVILGFAVTSFNRRDL